MAFSRDEVQAALETLFRGAWTATPAEAVAFENRAFEIGAQAGPWVEVRVQRGISTALTVELAQRMDGIVWVTAHVPAGAGKAAATRLLDAAAAVFLGAVVPVGAAAHLGVTGATGELPNTGGGFLGLQVGFTFSVL